jgi:hypothetical protein
VADECCKPLYRRFSVIPSISLLSEDYAFEVCSIMRGRTYPKEAWETLGLPVDACLQTMGEAARRSQAHLSAFTRVTSALKTIGLLSERMRPHYAQIGLCIGQQFFGHLRTSIYAASAKAHRCSCLTWAGVL